uniref:Cytochrome P450 n=1 Tax=Timema poppense TaxID=170557 RepID=A0A7R9DM17_TIMPO|nr:unnamed protein product [Timema poppensis]
MKCRRFITDVIGSCAFDLEINSMKQPDSEIRRMGNKCLALFRIDFPTELEMIRNQIASNEINYFLPQEEKGGQGRLLAVTDSAEKQGEEMTDTLLSAQCFVFFLVWYETSSTTISCCLHELAVNPDFQEKLRKEVDTFLIKHGGQITYEDLQESKYMDVVVDGLRFGCMQVKVGLTALLSKYKLSVCEKTSIPVTFNPISFITLWPRDIHLEISHRDN